MFFYGWLKLFDYVTFVSSSCFSYKNTVFASLLRTLNQEKKGLSVLDQLVYHMSHRARLFQGWTIQNSYSWRIGGLGGRSNINAMWIVPAPDRSSPVGLWSTHSLLQLEEIFNRCGCVLIDDRTDLVGDFCGFQRTNRLTTTRPAATTPTGGGFALLY